MQRYIVSEQILGAMLSDFFLNKRPKINEIKLSELNSTIRSISYQVQEQCEAIVDFSGKDIYRFINNNEKYFWLDEDRIVLSQYTEQKRELDYNGIQDLFDTKFIAGLPEDIISVVNESMTAV